MGMAVEVKTFFKRRASAKVSSRRKQQAGSAILETIRLYFVVLYIDLISNTRMVRGKGIDISIAREFSLSGLFVGLNHSGND